MSGAEVSERDQNSSRESKEGKLFNLELPARGELRQDRGGLKPTPLFVDSRRNETSSLRCSAEITVYDASRITLAQVEGSRE